ncbi:MAG: serine/threonine protein kinase [Candidatus Riflebacteria bacterium]|nr:serine/threonine protein kinase [Candidatus Riflebacteria bacterium]
MRKPDELIRDRYKVICVLGEASRGVVYKVFDQDANREAALKMLSEEAANDENWLRRAIKEGEILATIRHRAVVQFYSLEKEGRIPFLVMEWIDGKRMAEIKEELRKDLPTLFHHFLELLDGINECHRRRAIHRNITPSNLLINIEGQLKIIDFGIAKTPEKLTKPGTILCNNPTYMAPEVCQGEKASESSDIYSIGVVIWEFLTGKIPFEIDATKPILNVRQLLDFSNLPLQMERFDAFPQFAPLRNIIERMLEKQPRFRPTIDQIIANFKNEISGIITSSTLR